MKSKGIRRGQGREKNRRFRHSQLGDNLDVFDLDQNIHSQPSDNRNRRSVVIKRASHGQACGFTLQTYGLYKKITEETELLTYVDYVELGSPAYQAGLRAGDVILSLDGVSVENFDHWSLVSYIRNTANSTLRMVVLFDDCCKKIELHARALKLEQVMTDKMQQLQILESREQKLFSLETGSVSVTSNNSSVCKEQLSSDCGSPINTETPDASPLLIRRKSYDKTADAIANAVTTTDSTSSYSNVIVPAGDSTSSHSKVIAPAGDSTSSYSNIVSDEIKRSFDCEMHKKSLLWTLNPSCDTPNPTYSGDSNVSFKNHWYKRRVSQTTFAKNFRRRDSDGGAVSRHRGRYPMMGRRRSVSVLYTRRMDGDSATSFRDGNSGLRNVQERNSALRSAARSAVIGAQGQYEALEDEETKL